MENKINHKKKISHENNNNQEIKNNNFNYNVFVIYINLYFLSKKTENNLKRPCQIKEEYYLINLDWIKEFKKKFHYKELEKFLELHYDQKFFEIIIKNKKYAQNIYKKSKFNNIKIDKNEFNKINKIPNDNNIYQEFKNYNLKYCINFAFVNKRIIDELKKYDFIIDTEPKIDIYLGNHNFIFDVNINCLECVFCQDYDNYIDEYLINYIGKEHKKKAESEIMEKGLQYYFDINKINRNNYEEQYIYDIQTSQKIAIVININANKKKEIRESINSIITKYCEEALSESMIDKKREDDNILDIKTQMILNIKKNNKNQINWNKNYNNNKNDYMTEILTKYQQKDELSFNNYDPNRRIGLLNLGNSCFINSVLQCLFHIQDLAKYFLKNNFSNYSQTPLSFTLQFFVQALYKPKKNENENDKIIKYYKYNPFDICNIVSLLNNNFSPKEPNDAKDFLIFILGVLHQELNKPNNTKNYYNIIKDSDPLSQFFSYFASNYRSIISDIFNWTNQVRRICKNPECKSQIFSYQTFPYLILDLEKSRRAKYEKHKKTKFYEAKATNNDINNMEKWFNEYCDEKENIPIDLIDCIQYYYENENNFQFICPYCKSICPQSSTNRIYISPHIFVFILNRGKNNIYSVKMNYPQTLQLGNYIEKNMGLDNYELIGVITHLGLSGPNGHFVAFAKNPIDNNWYEYNDEIVNQANIFNIHNTGIPYILFYRAIES